MGITSDILIEMAGSAELGVRTDYSGRGMFGRRCIGVTGRSVMEIIAALTEVGHEDVDKGDLANLIRSAQQDQMGLDVILYWPYLQAPEEG